MDSEVVGKVGSGGMSSPRAGGCLHCARLRSAPFLPLGDLPTYEFYSLCAVIQLNQLRQNLLDCRPPLKSGLTAVLATGDSE